jgi:hypothetical protein
MTDGNDVYTMPGAKPAPGVLGSTPTPEPTPNDGFREQLRRAREVQARRAAKASTAPVSEAGGVQRTTIVDTDADGFEEFDDVWPEPVRVFGHVVDTSTGAVVDTNSQTEGDPHGT